MLCRLREFPTAVGLNQLGDCYELQYASGIVLERCLGDSRRCHHLA